MELLDLPARKHMKRLDARQSDTRRHPGKKKGRTNSSADHSFIQESPTMTTSCFPIRGFRTTILAALFFSALLTGCSKSPAELQKKYQGLGEHYLAEGKLNEAVIEFQNLLKINPKSAIGHYDLGQAYHKKGWIIESVIQDREATKLDPLMLPAHIALAEYAINSGQWSPAKDEIAAILKIDPRNAEGYALAGQRMLGLGREKEADQDLKHALSIKPGYARALVALGDLKRKQGQPKEARSYYKQALQANPSIGRALTGLGMLAQSENNSVLAREEFRKSLKVDPYNLRSRIVYANFLASGGHLHKAISALEAIPAKKSDVRIPVKIAEYETLLGENQKAINLLLPLAQQKLQIPDINFVLAKAYEQSGKKEDALQMVNGLLSMGSVPPIIKIGAARIELFEGKPQEASTILQSLAPVPDLPPTYPLTQSQVALALKRPDQAVSILTHALSRYPGNIDLQLSLADARMSAKQWKPALTIINEVLSDHPENIPAIQRKGFLLGKTSGASAQIGFLQREAASVPSVEPLYLQSLLANKRPGKALAAARGYLKDHPENTNVRLFLANIYLREGKLSEAKGTYKTILAADPKNLPAVLSLASIAMTQKNYTEAESNFRRALTLSPDNSGLYSALGEVLLAEKQRDAANKAFHSALIFNPENPAAILEVSKSEILSGQGQEALSRLSALLKSPLTKERKAEVEWLWGLANEQAGDPAKAKKALVLATSLDPGNPGYHASLGDFWADHSRWEDARNEYRKSLALQPDNPVLELKKTWLSVQSSRKPDPARIRKVIALAETYRATHPADISATMLEAQGELLLNKPEKALPLFDAILSSHPDNTGARLGKAGILLSQGKTEEAKNLGTTILADHPDNLAANLLMARIDQKNNDFTDEADRLEKLHQKHPDWIQPSLTLVAVDLKLKRFREAESIADSILSVKPGLYNARFLKAQAELDMADYRGALRNLSALAKANKKPAPLYLIMSVAAMKEGDTQEEKHALDKAFHAAPDDPMVLNNMAFFLASHTTHYAKALEYAKKAASIDKHPYIQDTVGYVLFRMGRFSQAQSYFESAWNAHFRDPEFLYHMGMNEWKIGQPQKARTILKRALDSGKLTPEEERDSRQALGAMGA
ncbi:hypothetical protein BOX24_04555 [Leptospirillum ferriphilum]|uniref:Uncharacterized protein n=4 Tax=Leptospirillum ferriphilum TaxID=178606 RepID=A0A059Y1S9_9BACT|nr:hypothetical protein Y981_03150 [Leptospirillum ferriphilum YSK]OOH73333.1 hypothetical protein BOX24_04555 [Leptospirillum ferriphilum]